MHCERCNKHITEQTARIYRGRCIPCHRQRPLPRFGRSLGAAAGYVVSFPSRLRQTIAYWRFSRGRRRTSADAVSFAQSAVSFRGESFELPYLILDAIAFRGGFAVIYDYMQMPERERQNNLEAFDSLSARLWVAESPNHLAAAYTHFVCAHPLRADNLCSYECTFDPATGKIVRSIFFK